MAEAAKPGRPSAFTPDLATTICERIAAGESLRQMCETDAKMPHRDTVHAWLLEVGDPAKKAFSDQYARARELQADTLFDQCLTIADDAKSDYREVDSDGDGPAIQVVDHEHISRSRLRVDTRFKIAGKLAPKKYGDRVAVTGPDGGAVKHEDVTASAAKDQAIYDLGQIFGAGVIAAVAKRSAAEPARVDRVVRSKPHKGRRQKRRASAAGKAVARSE